MTVKEAVIRVLKTEAKPLHTKVITEMILSRGLWQTQGRTPAATVEAQITFIRTLNLILAINFLGMCGIGLIMDIIFC